MYILDIPRAARLCLSICSVKGRKGAKEVRQTQTCFVKDSRRKNLIVDFEEPVSIGMS